MVIIGSMFWGFSKKSDILVLVNGHGHILKLQNVTEIVVIQTYVERWVTTQERRHGYGYSELPDSWTSAGSWFWDVHSREP